MGSSLFGQIASLLRVVRLYNVSVRYMEVMQGCISGMHCVMKHLVHLFVLRHHAVSRHRYFLTMLVCMMQFLSYEWCFVS